MIRGRPTFVLRRARRSDGAACLFVEPGPLADPPQALAALRSLASAHDEVRHPHVARTLAAGEGPDPFVALEGAFVADGMEIMQRLAVTDARIPYAAADAFIVGLRGALEASHATADPARGGPRCLGRFSPANVLFRDDGEWLLVGLGHNVAAESERGAADPTVPSFHPPELAAGGAPTPMGDYLALLLFMRSVLPYVAVEGDLARLLAGDIRPGDAALIEALQWTERHVFGELAPLRPTMAEAVRVADGVRALLGVTLDAEGFRRFVREHLAARGPGVALARDASWVRVDDGGACAVGRAGRGMLLALAEQHVRAPGSTLSLWELIDAGWPGERIAAEAATNRAHVALNQLRRSGLRAALERVGDGYRLAPTATLRFEEP